eukprot:TRINITY_DN17594_c0_g1_i1.p1 TRINITY_DN17594_c0_g1~~TRINITY_DN17594_c0_g1_i1.p1  ORF type:complete len:332 (+),score=49.43 TRINITY_DN17594_c0_g1_i1:275-1270(+)
MRQMASRADVFIEPFRPGVCEKLGLGPDVLCKLNSRLIYGRMTGFGQGGNKFEKMAGHDANYLALSGLLDLFRRGDERPFPPVNFAGDYAGGAVMLVMGVLLSVIERASSGKGQVVDAAMVDGAAYVALPMFKWMQGGFLPVDEYGHLDAKRSMLNQAPPWVESYECKPDPSKPGLKQYVSVQAIEPQFYEVLIRLLGLSELPSQLDADEWPATKTMFAQAFLTKTRDEWAEIFYGTDACVVPVLNPHEAALHPHNQIRGTYGPTPGSDGEWEPAPAPKLSRTPGHQPRASPEPGAHTEQVLREFGLSESEVQKLLHNLSLIHISEPTRPY